MISFRTFIALLFTTAATATAWVPAPCPTGDIAGQRDFAAKVAGAKPGEPLYVPNIRPKNPQAVIDNFLYQHLQAWSDTPNSALPIEERHLLEAIRQGTAEYQVERVENWTAVRCQGRQRHFFHVVRVFEGGDEITRAALDDWGFISYLQHKPGNIRLSDQFPKPFPATEVVALDLANALGRSVRRAQLVAVDGTVRCPAIAPCIAFIDDGIAFVATLDGRAIRNVLRLDLDGMKVGQVLSRDVRGGSRSRAVEWTRDGFEILSVGNVYVRGVRVDVSQSGGRATD